ncbi:hypothetical protein CHS0354_006170 [Potamilus streckersoni]|uniref:PCNA-associated factor n=1 Tax=Potamilus streckersoni TaxID=2493646 RepID=A0AAE0STD0_9BIVA|nr:hypothetical protein CHS0354_006170 [Potamilus streckersoni]
MVRTKANGCAASRKVVAASAPRKSLGGGGGGGAASSSSSSGVSSSGKNKYAGCNPVCMRPTPEWQKGIGSFFTKSQAEGKENSWQGADGSSGKTKAIDKAGPSGSIS